MLLEVGEFCQRVQSGMGGLVRELQAATGRYGDAERAAWTSSLTRVAKLLGKPQLEAFRAYHLSFGQRGAVAVEYRLPASASWCDVVLLGRRQQKPAAVVLELKDWETAGDRPGPTESLIERQGRLDLHPADQVRGYVEYCRRFHSVVLDAGADVHGCVYFTKPVPTASYVAPPHDRLTADFPVFADHRRDVEAGLPDFLSTRLERPDFGFACRFEQGSYRQDREFCVQMARQIEDPESNPFVLLDGQRRGFELCWESIRRSLADASPDRRKVVVIEGPPGSGKSVIAARLWAALVADESIPKGNVVLTTTSSSQKSNWENLFEKAARSSAGAGVVMPANRYSPETTMWVGQHMRRHPGVAMRPEEWRQNVMLVRRRSPRLRCEDGTFLVSVVDEAHALINPERPGTAGPTGWPAAFGPQAWHVIRASRVSVFLMDGEQSFRDRETTTAEDIEEWGREQGAEVIPRIRLMDTQFRLGGSAEYMAWLESLLSGSRDPETTSWRRTPENADGRMTFEIVDDPLALEDRLRERIAEGHTARLLAAYGREWKTKGIAAPHSLPPHQKDFDIVFRRDGRPVRWSKVWNFAPGNGSPDYTLFVQAPAGSEMAKDPLCEVGCPYVVRGFDYGYLGVLWLSDLVRRGDRWYFDPGHIHESGLRFSLAAAKREKKHDGPGTRALLRRLQQAYRILLSRALHGVYVWFEDEETRRYVESRLASEPVLPFRVIENPAAAERFRTCVPIVRLEVAAGLASEIAAGHDPAEWADEWAEMPGGRRLEPGMFVARVRGDSMDLEIPDGAWCLFRRPPEGTRTGRIVLASHGKIADPVYGARFTVKQYWSEKASTEDGSLRHRRIELRPMSTNPAHKPIVLGPEDAEEVRILGEFVDVVTDSVQPRRGE